MVRLLQRPTCLGQHRRVHRAAGAPPTRARMIGAGGARRAMDKCEQLAVTAPSSAAGGGPTGSAVGPPVLQLADGIAVLMHSSRQLDLAREASPQLDHGCPGVGGMTTSPDARSHHDRVARGAGLSATSSVLRGPSVTPPSSGTQVLRVLFHGSLSVHRVGGWFCDIGVRTTWQRWVDLGLTRRSTSPTLVRVTG
jgi:hypothetical protein